MPDVGNVETPFDEYVDPSTLAGGEPFCLDDDEVPTREEGRSFAPTRPGVYANPSRILHGVPKLQKDSNWGFTLKLTGGVVVNGRVTDTKYPHYVYINTTPRDVLDFSTTPPTPKKKADGTPLRVSDVNRYLRLCGVDPKGLTIKMTPTGPEGSLLDAVNSTLTTPVGVKIEWEDKTEKTGEKNEKGKDVYAQSSLRTKDFVVGTSASGKPVYSHTVRGILESRTSAKGKTYYVFKATEDGILFTAKAVVSYFTELPKEV